MARQLLVVRSANCYSLTVKYSSILSANHPYLQPEGWIAKGAAQRDRPNAFERRLWRLLRMIVAEKYLTVM